MSENRKHILKLRQITDQQRAASIKVTESWNLLTIIAEFIEAEELHGDNY
jgi:hypothetical protein